MNPVILEYAIAIGANQTIPNVLQAVPDLSRYLRAPMDCDAELFAVSAGALTYITMDYGSKNVVDESLVRTATSITVPYDLINGDFHPQQGDQLVLKAQNRTGAGTTLFFRLVLKERTPEVERPTDTRSTQDFTQLPTAGILVHFLQGRRYERPPVPCLAEFFMTASSVGSLRQLYVETTNVAPPTTVPALNRIPRDPDDQCLSDVEVPAGQQIDLAGTVAVNNDVIFWRMNLKELIPS
jgi:hypothetical protein